MTTAANVIAVAASQVGYHEVGTNWTKYWQELEPGLQGKPWCAAFASWSFMRAGHTLPNMGVPYGYISAAAAMNWAKAHGYWDASGHYAPADLLIYGGGTHTGVLVTDDGRTIHAIEGNEGDMVQATVRSHGLYVSGVIKASRMLNTTPYIPPVVPPHRGSAAQTRAVQTAVHITADGVWGPITTYAGSVVVNRNLSSVKYLQARIGAVQDGIWGAVSERARLVAVKRIQAAVGVAADGVWGSRSKAAYAAAYAANHI